MAVGSGSEKSWFQPWKFIVSDIPRISYQVGVSYSLPCDSDISISYLPNFVTICPETQTFPWHLFLFPARGPRNRRLKKKTGSAGRA